MKSYLLLLLLSISCCLFSQNIKEFSEYNIASEKYFVENFEDGYAVIQKKGFYGLINNAGKVIIDTKYDNLEKIAKTCYRAKLNGKLGIVKTNGLEKYPLDYDYIFKYSSNFAKVFKSSDKLLIEDMNFYSTSAIKGKYGFIDTNGNEICSAEYDLVDNFENNFARVYIGELKSADSIMYGVDTGRYCGLINKKGEEVTEIKYNYIGNFSDGLAVVFNGNLINNEPYKGKFGYINKKGEEIIPLKYDWAEPFSDRKEKMAIVYTGKKEVFINQYGVEQKQTKESTENYSKISKKNNKYGLIDNKGKIIIPFQYNQIKKVVGKIITVKKSNKWAFFNRDGKQLSDFKYDSITYNFFFYNYSRLRAITVGVKNDSNKYLYGAVNQFGVEIVPPKYDVVNPPGPYQSNYNTLIRVELNKKYGFVNFKGKEVTPIVYDFTRSYDNYTKVFKGETMRDGHPKKGIWGLLDSTGKLIMPIKYNCLDIYYHNEKYIHVFKGETMDAYRPKKGLFGVSSITGKEIIPVKYQKLWFSEGLFSVSPLDHWNENNKKFGFIDLLNDTIIPFIYEYASNFNFGITNVKLKGKWMLINKKGEVISAKYDDITRIHQNNHYSYKGSNGKYGLMNKRGEIILTSQFETGIYTSFKVNKNGNIRVIEGGNSYNKPTKHYYFNSKEEILFGPYNMVWNNKEGLIRVFKGEIIRFDPNMRRDTSINDKGDTIIKETNQEFENKIGEKHVQYPSPKPIEFKYNGVYGYLNEGKELTPLVYEHAEDFMNGKAKVTLNGKTFYINKKGETIK